MPEKKWKVREVPGYEVEWYIVVEQRGTNLEVLDYENVNEDKVKMLIDSLSSLFHDLKMISDKELKGLPTEKKNLDVVVKTEKGYMSMSFIADSILVVAGLREKRS